MESKLATEELFFRMGLTIKATFKTDASRVMRESLFRCAKRRRKSSVRRRSEEALLRQLLRVL